MLRIRALAAAVLTASLIALAPTVLAAPPEAGCAPDPCATPECDPYPCCDCRMLVPPPCPPKYHNLRFQENWRPCLCEPCGSWGDWSDKFKARRLGGSVWMNVGGQVRLRWESFGNIGFGAPADDNDAWLLLRTRVHADVHFGENLRVFAEGIFADQYELRELGPRPIDRNKGDLLNLFAEAKGNLGGFEVGAWLGRRELQLGKQRLVSPLDWANTRRTFQGAGGWWKAGHHTLQGFLTHPVVIEPDALDDDWNEDAWFWGLNYTNESLDCLTWEAYLLGLEVDPPVDQQRFTLGARIDGKLGGTRLDYDLEAAYQLGDQGAGDITAWMVSATVGYKPCAPCWEPRVALGFDYASGDDDPADPDVGTFNQLFPLAHKYLGHADLIGRQNVVAARLEAHVKPAEKLTVSAWLHLFWRAEEADAAYTVTGGVLRAPGGSSETSIGTELDVMLKYTIDRHWVAFLEWAHFFAGDFIEATGASEDVDVWYLGIQGTF